MAVHVPVHPEAGPLRSQRDGAQHELLDDVVGEEGTGRSQRIIAWLCAALTAAAAIAAWRLL